MTPFLLGILSGIMIVGGVIGAFFSILGNDEGKFVLSMLSIIAAILLPLVFML